MGIYNFISSARTCYKGYHANDNLEDATCDCNGHGSYIIKLHVNIINHIIELCQ